MMKYNLNILQKNILKYYTLHPNTNAFNQCISCDFSNKNVINWDVYVRNIYHSLVILFPILRSIVNVSEETYVINDAIDINKFTVMETDNIDILSTTHRTNFDKYLFVVLSNKISKRIIFIFNHLFVDGASEQLIYDFLTHNHFNDIIKTTTIDHNKYYDYKFDYQHSSIDGGLELKLIPDIQQIDNIRYWKGETIKLKLDNIEKSLIREYCKKISITTHTFYVAILCISLQHFTYNECDKFVIYDTFSGRPEKYKQTIGFFSFLFPVIIDRLLLNNKINVFFEEVQKILRNCGEKLNYKYTESTTIFVNDARGLPFFKESIISQDNGNDIPREFEMKILDFNYFLFKYDISIIKKETARKIVDLFEWVLRHILSIDINKKLNEINFVTDNDVNMMEQWNQTDISYTATFMDKFKENCALYPNKTAIIDGCTNSLYNYTYVNEKSNIICNYLQQHNIINNSIVCICVEKTIKMAIGILGIIKSGAAWCPILPNCPDNRKKEIINDTKSNILLDDSMIDHILKNNNFNVTLPIETELKGESPIYVMHTSGTTGKPKGVIITYDNLNNYLNSNMNICSVNDTTLCACNYVFDVMIAELLLPLFVGGTVYMYDVMSVKKIQNVNEDNIVNIIISTPTIVSHIINNDLIDITKITKIIVIGEKLSENSVIFQRDHYEVYNAYGPTEATITVTEKLCKNNKDTTIGKPTSNNKIYILDKNLKLVPIGTTGQICIGGKQVSSMGYLNDLKLTNKKFVRYGNNNELIYLTGDIGKWCNDGDIEIFGRCDNQIKINGVRTEPEEIESIIKTIPGVFECIIIFKDNILIAHVKTSKNDTQLKIEMKHILPKHMIPNKIIIVNEFSFNSNGKIDRIKLKQLYDSTKIELLNTNAAVLDEKNLSKNDKMMHHIWKDVLGVNSLGIDDDFFNMGGNSLKLSILIAKINNTFNKYIPTETIIENSTVRKLCAQMPKDQPKRIVKKGKYLFAIHGLFGVTEIEIAISNNPEVANLIDIPVYDVLISEEEQKQHNIWKLTDLVKYHAKTILSIQKSGVYNLIGYCYGGTIAALIIMEILKTKKIEYSLTVIDTLFTLDQQFVANDMIIDINYPDLFCFPEFKKLAINCLILTNEKYRKICKKKIEHRNDYLKIVKIKNTNEHYIKDIDIKFWKIFFSFVR